MSLNSMLDRVPFLVRAHCRDSLSLTPSFGNVVEAVEGSA